MSLSAAEVASRCALDRPGYRLLGFEDVVIPLFRLTIEAITQRRKAIPPIEEFVLRAVGTGLDKLDDITGFLGLDRKLVEAAVISQWQMDNIDYRLASLERGRRVSLTEKGRMALSDLRTVAPERADIGIDFDRLAWRVTVPSFSVLRPRDLRDGVLREIPPRYAARKPSLEDLSIEEVSRIVKTVQQARGQDYDVLAIRDIVRTERVYQPAVMLIYQAQASADVEIAFAIDGRISRVHEASLAALGGAERLGLKFGAPEIAAPLSVPLEQVAPDEVVDDLHRRVAEAKKELEKLRERSTLPETEVDQIDDADQVLAQKLEAAQSALDAIPLRRVRVFEHPILLVEAITRTQKRLLIIAPWISLSVVDDTFLYNLEMLSKRGVQIHIGYDIGDGNHDPQPVRQMENLVQRYPNFHFKRLGYTHAKVLIWDERMVVGSFNWLSFKGDPNRTTFRQEESLFVGVAAFVDKYYQEHIAEIEGNLADYRQRPRDS